MMGGPQDGMVGAVGEILKESRLLRALDLAYGADRGGNVRERPFAQGIAQATLARFMSSPMEASPSGRRNAASSAAACVASRLPG
ncbi:MAG: hypothetical protein ACLR7Z_01695 [Bilophila wadsworthia]